MGPMEDLIVAVGSPPGRSWRGLLRLSGPHAAVEDWCRRALGDGDWVGAGVTRQLRRAVYHATAGPGQGHGGAAWSCPVLVMVFHGPASYTGQDMVEVQCPGHPALLERMLRQAVGYGARLAQAGEFTFRALAGGKMDLTQAEGVAATIAAAGNAELAAAGHLRRGELGRWAQGLVEELVTLLALVESGIDFTDQEDVVPIPPAELQQRLTVLAEQVDQFLAQSRPWAPLEALPRVVLVGPPSSGKSTLFNALLGRERAVTSPIPGTTRDVLEEPMTLPSPAGLPVEVMLVDVAGLNQPTYWLDQQAQAAAREAMARADVWLVLEPGPGGATVAPTSLPVNKPALVIRPKADLSPASGMSPVAGATTTTDGSGALPVSAVTGQGLAELRQRLAALLGAQGVSLSGSVMTLLPRHELALQQARTALHEARALAAHDDAPGMGAEAGLGMSAGPGPGLPGAGAAVELVAGALRLALEALGELVGKMTPDDVLERVFARFCIGK